MTVDRRDAVADSEQAALCQALLLLRDPAECAAFFDDLCTYQELAEMARRLRVARLLRQGLNYQQIAAETGVSTATISRVNRALRYGAGGYQTVLARLEAREEANDDSGRAPSSGKASEAGDRSAPASGSVSVVEGGKASMAGGRSAPASGSVSVVGGDEASSSGEASEDASSKEPAPGWSFEDGISQVDSPGTAPTPGQQTTAPGAANADTSTRPESPDDGETYPRFRGQRSGAGRPGGKGGRNG